MGKRIGILLLSVWLPFLAFVAVVRVSALGALPSNQLQVIDTALVEKLADDPVGDLSFIVHLSPQAELTEGLPQARASRRAAVVTRLRQTATEAQQDLLSSLDAMRAAGTVAGYQPLWIINAVAVDGDERVLYALAGRPDVAAITLNARQQFVEPPQWEPEGELPQNWNLEQIRAYHVWHGLGVDGEGTTVAIMDTGVDWRHPALLNRYRGMQDNGTVRHAGNWYDVVDSSQPSAEPIDPNGHGTHVAGIAVGELGIGVAPGANWIAVRTFDSEGFASIAEIHLAFQWLLAPDGQVELAPDVVNGSWSGGSQITAFQEDVHALHQAGIVTVFAAGNDGPFTGTIGAPASYERTIAVAATDDRPEVTWFSGRGPSPNTDEAKPDLAAPGAPIYSALPDGAYGSSIGTSMAAPHVSGAAALLLSANPALSIDEVAHALTSTAESLSAGEHSIASGWGLLDLYEAVGSQPNSGSIVGVIADGDSPLPGALITVTNSAGAIIRLRAGEGGSYEAWLQPGSYQVRASAFGHLASESGPIGIAGDFSVQADLVLPRLPHTNVTGQVTARDNNQPIPGVAVVVAGTPVRATTDESGNYSLSLPSEYTYHLRAQHVGHRILTETITLAGDTPATHNFQLGRAPTILLVDSGHWYYASEIEPVRQALLDAAYTYDSWDMYDPFAAPTAETLQLYDVVIWNAPQDSPGRVGGGQALITYLGEGGNLFISGQNVAMYDGAGAGPHRWFAEYLGGQYIGAATAPYTVTGVSGSPLAKSRFVLQATGGEADQPQPALVAPREGSLTNPALIFADEMAGAAAALHAGRCRPYDIFFLGFGFENIRPVPAQTTLIADALAHFENPQPSRAIALKPVQTNEVAIPGQTMTVTWTLQNLSEAQTTTIQLDYESAWPSTLSQESIVLGPCEQEPVTMTLQVPQQLPPDARQAIEITAEAAFGAAAGASIVATAPQPILLVADYRWYDRRPVYQQALLDLDLSYDVWDTTARGSPTAERLAIYPTVLWFTGYDWYQPLTSGEIDALETYLSNGGRLFLSSQDFLYYHHDLPFAQRYLGVVDYQETISSTTLLGGSNALVGDDAGPFTLQYEPYRNFSDSLVPGTDSNVFVWNDFGLPAGIATRGNAWRTVFWGAPFELLPDEGRTLMLGRILGWLGNLGDSLLRVTPRVGSPTESRQYTLTVRNWQYGESHEMTATIGFDSNLVPDPSSVTGGAVFDAESGLLTWRGALEPGADHDITFRADHRETSDPGEGAAVTATVHYAGSASTWQNVARTWFAAPDLSASYLRASPDEVKSGRQVTFTAFITNRGYVPADAISATLSLPRGARIITDTLQASSGEISATARLIHWQGSLDAQGAMTFSLRTTMLGNPLHGRMLPAGLVISDGRTHPVVDNRIISVAPNRSLFPFIRR